MNSDNSLYRATQFLIKHKKYTIPIAIFLLISLSINGYIEKNKAQAIERNKAALKLGFKDAEEMKAMQSKGFKDKKAFILSEAERLGFRDPKEMKDADTLGFESKQALTEKINAIQWQKILIRTTVTDNKGGVFIEKNWFSPDRISVKSASTSISNDASYINQASIQKINDEVVQASFKVESYGKWYDINDYQINCPSNTYKKIRHYSIKNIPAEITTSVDQKTGKSQQIQTPEKIELAGVDHNEGEWRPITTAELSKYKDAACNQNFNLKVDTTYRN